MGDKQYQIKAAINKGVLFGAPMGGKQYQVKAAINKGMLLEAS